MHFSFRALFSLAVVLPIVTALPYAERAIDVSEEMVVTPVGLRAKSSLVLVPNDAKIHHTDNEVQVIHNNGTILHTSARFVKPAQAFSTGWVAYASYLVPTSTPITSFTTTWKVPANPATNHGQTVFLFNSIEPATGDSILQPVLQWGPSAAGGGAYWAVGSWYVGTTSTFFSPLVKVSVGQSLTGVISINAAAKQYTSSFTGISQSSLTISNGPQLVWATETLEAYGITAKSDYPTGSTAFTNINLAGPSSVSWSTVSNSADGLTTTVVRNGGSNAEVDIHYT